MTTPPGTHFVPYQNAHFVPYVNGPELLAKALESVRQHHEYVVVIDNRDAFTDQPDPARVTPYDVTIWKPQMSLTHSQLMTWLVLKMQAAGYRWFTWMHNDCQVLGDTLTQLRSFAQSATELERKWGVILTCDPSKPQDGPWNHVDVCEAINVDAMMAIGGWDWNRFPDYFSDYDAYAKLTRAGYEVIRSGYPILHMGGSSTAALDANRAMIKHITWGARSELWRLRSEELGVGWPPR